VLAYRFFRRLLAMATALFFRQVEVVGEEHIPVDGEPVIFAGNHPNSLLDPVLILVTCGRIVHFAAKDVLFRSPIVAFLLRRLGAVPVARRSDHEGAPLDNQQAFERLAEVVGGGGAMGIFPEGLSHDQSQLGRLKTGAARIALDVGARCGVAVKVVPCGLHYVRRKRFRTRVLVQYGEPIVVAPEAGGAASRERVRALTDEIERGLRALTVNAPDWETLSVLDAVRRLYQPPAISLAERVELARRFNEGYLRAKDEADVAALYARVARYLGRLRALGLRDRDVRREMGPVEVLARALRHLVLVAVWLPLAAPGIALHAPVVAAISWVGPRLAPRKDVTATTKLVLGLFLVPLSLCAVVLAIGWRWGTPAAALAAALLALSGLATVRVLERGARLRQLVGASSRLIAFRAEVAALRAERSALEVEVVRAVERHIPPEMVPMFPR
jgi:1-acyl-sn-glycerol-3-phosphate acyltransferase